MTDVLNPLTEQCLSLENRRAAMSLHVIKIILRQLRIRNKVRVDLQTVSITNLIRESNSCGFQFLPVRK